MASKSTMPGSAQAGAIPVLRSARVQERQRRNQLLINALEMFSRGEVEADELAPYLMTFADDVASTKIGSLPSFVTKEDLISALYLKITPILRNIDPSMDAFQMLQYVYRCFEFALIDEGRSKDPWPKRMRTRINKFQRDVEEAELKVGRKLTDSERREIAKGCLGPKMLKGKDVDHLLNLLTTGMTVSAMTDEAIENASAAFVEESDDVLDEDRRAQALHIAAANIDDDKVHAAVVSMLVDQRPPTEASIRKAIEFSLRDQLERIGVREWDGV